MCGLWIWRFRLSYALGSDLGIFWWVCDLVLGGGFVIWFWMGMVCGGLVVVGICLMVFFAVDWWWLMVGGYEFYGLVLGLGL